MNQSGKIYVISLDFGYGFLFAEMLDFYEISAFSGVITQVYNYRVKEINASISMEDITSSGLLLRPLSLSAYPATRGKYAWKLWGENLKHDFSPPYFKYYQGLRKAKDWSKLTPWFKQSQYTEEHYSVECTYEDVRYLETTILNHQDTVKIKCTMRLIIDEGKDVSQFYDLNELGYRNTYVQIVNTYYDLETANRLLEATYDLK